MIDWSNYCEDVKDRARDVIKLLRTAAQVDKDRRFAMNIAREEGKDDERQDDGNDGAPGGGDREEVVPAAGSLIGQPGASTKSPPVIQTSPSPVPTVPQSSAEPATTATSVSAGSVSVPPPGVSSSTTTQGQTQQNYTDTNLELATKAVNNLGNSINCDIAEIEQEVDAAQGVMNEKHVDDIKELCVRLEERIMGEFARAGEKLARLDLGRRTNVLDSMDQTTTAQLRRIRTILAALRRARSTTPPDTSVRSSTSSTSASHTPGFRPFLEKLKVPTFSGRVEDWPEFRSVWKDLLDTYPDSIQVQHIKTHIPAGDARRVAGVKSMAEIWKRLEKIYGDTQLNILTVKNNLENLIPKAVENYKRVMEIFEAVETAATQLSNLEALHYVKDDFGLISKLILKLPDEYQDQYAEYVTSDTVMLDISTSRWDKFWTFMERLHKRAVQASLMNMCGSGLGKGGTVKSSTVSKSGITCGQCGGIGHFAKGCPSRPKSTTVGSTVRINMAVSKITTKGEYSQCLPELKKQLGSCPACNKPAHVYTRQFPFGKAEWPSRRLDSCPEFQNKSAKERGELLEKLKGCYKCTSWLHMGDNCFQKSKINCSVVTGGKQCAGVHHKTLHGSGVAFCHKTQVVMAKGTKVDAVHDDVDGVPDINQPVLLEVQAIMINKVLAKLMWDGGSSGALITHSFAEQAGLRGEKVAYWLVVVGHPRVLRHTMLYSFVMVDNNGVKHKIQAYGIDQITEDTIMLDLEGIRAVFPGAPKEVFERPAGPIDILIGSMFKNIQPCGGEDGFTRGRLRLSRSLFGCGFVLSGTHPAISTMENTVCENARSLANHATMAREGDAVNTVSVMSCNRSVSVASLQIPEFFEAEEMGVAVNKACKRCRGCKDCSFRGLMVSREKEQVVKRMEDLIKYDEVKQKVSVSYPWTEDVCKLSDNIHQAIAFQKSFERKLIKDQRLLDAYNNELRKAMERGPLFSSLRRSWTPTRAQSAMWFIMGSTSQTPQPRPCAWSLTPA